MTPMPHTVRGTFPAGVGGSVILRQSDGAEIEVVVLDAPSADQCVSVVVIPQIVPAEAVAKQAAREAQAAKIAAVRTAATMKPKKAVTG